MSDPHPNVHQAQQTFATMDGLPLADRVGALEHVAALLDAALSDNAS